jgi:dienelactone hydrolase
MRKLITSLLLFLSIIQSWAQDIFIPDTVSVMSGSLTLKGLLWQPAGKGKFPAIIFCHGGYDSNDTTYPPLQTSVLGPVFVKYGYIFFDLFRRGVGLSSNQGENSADLMAKAFEEKGQEGRNKVQLEQMQTTQLQDMIAGLNFLRSKEQVDASRIAIIGHSFGGSLALLVAEHDLRLKAVIVFSAAGYSWDRSPPLRLRLLQALKNISAPVMILHAKNDYSLNPGYGIDSALTKLNKPHVLKIYPAFGTTNREAHNLVLLNTDLWKPDVLKFLAKNLRK